jgi:hypothetical protein
MTMLKEYVSVIQKQVLFIGVSKYVLLPYVQEHDLRRAAIDAKTVSTMDEDVDPMMLLDQCQ